MYLDYYQGVPESEPIAIGGFLPLSRVYEYDPIPKVISEQKAHFILGVQGNLWTEYIATPEHVEYMIFPRAAAVAEIGCADLRSAALFAAARRHAAGRGHRCNDWLACAGNG